jgi:hypothetical protein
MALTNKLSAIGDAIREKTGKTGLMTLDEMPVEIASITTGGGGGDIEPIVLTGDCSYGCGGALAGKFIEMFSDKISTQNLTKCNYMFYNYPYETIPFDINLSTSNASVSIASMFNGCNNLKTLPKIPYYNVYEITGMFKDCYNLREIPEDYFDGWDFTACKNATSAYERNASGIISQCYSLRKIPLKIFENMNPNINANYVYLRNGFDSLSTLDELVDMPLPYKSTYTMNIFYSTFGSCNRLKRITLQVNDDGTPLIKNWKAQTIDLSSYVGFTNIRDYMLKYNSGITADKEVKDDATYQALKNDPDWFTLNIQYSRYNHDSAVETINSLPDTSAYLATAGGTNTIKFRGRSGALTDGGAINTLTEEEIAVATSKGWTVSLV